MLLSIILQKTNYMNHESLMGLQKQTNKGSSVDLEGFVKHFILYSVRVTLAKIIVGT